MFDVAIIVINFNFENFTINLVESICENIGKEIKFQIIIVDNGSKKQSIKKLNSYLEKKRDLIPIKFITSKSNLGFGGGNTLGVKNANAEYYAFINSDVIFESDCISSLKKFMDSKLEVAVSTPNMLSIDRKPKRCFNHFISPAYEVFGRSTLEFFNPSRFPSTKKKYNSPLRVDSVAGAFMFFRASDFKSVNGFDNNIFLYFEETDICKRLKKIGKESYFVPDSFYIHYQGGSTSQSTKIKKELIISKYYVLNKHYNGIGFYIFWVVDIIRSFIKLLFKPSSLSFFYLKLLRAPIKYSMRFNQNN